MDQTSSADEAKPRPRRVSCTVAFVIGLFAFIYFTVVFIAVIPWLESSVHGVFNVAVFTLLTGAAFAFYMCCIFFDPGSVPVGWNPDVEGSSVMEVKKDGEVRFCNKCKQYKPPRTHHCRVCDRCVLRMDHHCVWINNCVGHKNYKCFLLFLLYVTAAVGHGLGLLLARTFSGMDNVRYMRKGAPKLGERLVSSAVMPLAQTLATIVSFPLSIALAMLLCWHIYLVVHNKTTIEYHEGVRSKWKRGERRGTVGRHPYDLGLCHNLHAVLGNQPGRWICGCSAEGDGVSYSVPLE